MKLRILATLTFFALAGTLAHAQLQVNLTWQAPGAASTITTGTNGTETAGPIVAQVYRVSIAAGGTCPAFSATTYTLLNGAVPLTTTAAAYTDSTVTTGSTVCYALTDTFAAGGAPSPVSNLFSLLVILTGTPAQPTGLSGTVVAAGS
jgi:hypothetical protein